MTRLKLLLAVIVLSPLTLNGDEPYQVDLFELPDSHQSQLQNYRQKWARLTGFEYSGLHWNQFISVYTDKGSDTYQHNYLQYITWYEDPDEFEGTPNYKDYPVGAVVLKENFAVEDGKPGESLSVTAMIKHAPGFDEANGNWEYLQFDAQGNILLRGNSRDENVEKNCASCHRHVADRDYIFSQVFSAAQRSER